MAYTYLIGWSKFNKFYYGVRFSKNCRPEDLWVSYFTSSKHVKFFTEEHGNPDIIQIRKVFQDNVKARLWEEKVLNKMNVLKDDRWLNRTNNKSIDPECAIKGTLSHIGKKRSEKTKKLISLSKIGKKDSLETKMKKSAARIGSKNPAHKGFVKTPLGVFETLREAAIAECCGISTISTKVNNPKIINYGRI